MAKSTHSPGEHPRGRGDGIARRRFVIGSLATGAAVAGAAGVGLAPSASASVSAGPTSGAGRRVAVFGGGAGGLTVAHERAERGFDVTVYERKELGGKSRSIPVRGTGSGGRKDLPGEHGFRFFPGFYQNLPETMSRIPLPGGGTVRDNLVDATEVVAAYRGRIYRLPTGGGPGGLLTVDNLRKFFETAIGVYTTVPAHEVNFFIQKLIVFMTSGPKRRLGQWEHWSYADYVRAERMSQPYRELLVDMFTSTLVAAKPDKANGRTMGLMAEAWAYSTMGRGPYESPDRLLNGPTNEAWIDPWLDHLRGLGVRFNVGWTLTDLLVTDRRISGAKLTDQFGQTSTVDADYYVLAVPVERTIPLLNPAILDADPDLAKLRRLETDWMNGVMLYLKQQVDIAEGHVAYAGQPWGLSSINQDQFWRNKFADTYGDGTVKDCLSLDLSAWDVPGILFNKPAKECSPEQIIAEIKAQVRLSLPNGAFRLPDWIIHSYFIDPAIANPGKPNVANDEPLLINTPGSWNDRPRAATGLPNLFLASDYVRADINLATMEAANEAGREAANAILDRAGSTADHAKMLKLWLPPEFAGIYADDDARYEAGLPNRYDTVDPHWP